MEIPDELLLRIFEEAEVTDLDVISLASKKCHSMVLPIQLYGLGITKSMTMPFDDLTFSWDIMEDAYHVRRSLAFISPPVKRITYIFRPTHLASDILLQDIRRFDRLVRSLASVDEVALDFSNLEVPSPLWERITWFTHLECLLDTIIVRSCKKLSITSRLLVNRASIVTEETPPEEEEHHEWTDHYLPIMFMKNTVRSLFGHHEPTPSRSQPRPELRRTITVSTNARASTLLTDFELTFPLMLRPPYMPWVTSILNRSPVTTLSIDHMGLSPSTWAEFLPAIYLPALTTLKLGALAVMPEHLVQFLVRHALITQLHLDRTLLNSNFPIQRRQSFLPRLRALEIDPDGLVRLTSLGDLAFLKRVHVLCRAEAGIPFSLAHLCLTLTPLAALLVPVQLSLRVSPESGSLDWLHADAVTHRCGHGEVCLLKSVIRLAFASAFVYATCPPTWLGNFVSLTHISFTGCTDPDNDIQYFINRILDTCPQVEVIDIEGATHKTADS